MLRFFCLADLLQHLVHTGCLDVIEQENECQDGGKADDKYHRENADGGAVSGDRKMWVFTPNGREIAVSGGFSLHFGKVVV